MRTGEPSGSLFLCDLDWVYHLEASNVIDLIRMHTYKAGEFLLVDVPLKEARRKAEELRRQGRVITHTEHV